MNRNTFSKSAHRGCERQITRVKQTQLSVKFASVKKYLNFECVNCHTFAILSTVNSVRLLLYYCFQFIKT